MSNLTMAAVRAAAGTAAEFHWAVLRKEWARRHPQDGRPTKEDLIKLAGIIGREGTAPPRAAQAKKKWRLRK